MDKSDIVYFFLRDESFCLTDNVYPGVIDPIFKHVVARSICIYIKYHHGWTKFPYQEPLYRITRRDRKTLEVIFGLQESMVRCNDIAMEPHGRRPVYIMIIYISLERSMECSPGINARWRRDTIHLFISSRENASSEDSVSQYNGVVLCDFIYENGFYIQINIDI
jgi:hypothetical protein